MYVVTFYSFKGGVGRTLALMNVAYELVSRGKTVLLVDFDLEAPGLEAFPSVIPCSSTPGIVEFVSEYLRTDIAPAVEGFVSQCELDASLRGRLLLMRSGVRDRTYSARLSTIDWQRLYSEHDGFLLFEDLKAQWQQQFHPDYILIDSRTGHTDVGGICTRQLPNAVVACFIPNEENVVGLETIVSEIRREAEPPAHRHIQMYFVPSNVPNLDDEQKILAKRISEAKRRLGFDAPACIIHRYESLSLLDNVLFVQKRRQSRLAKEYLQLTSTLAEGNVEDRDAVLKTLRSERFVDFGVQPERSLQARLTDIRVAHATDGEVLHEVGKLLRRLGREEDSEALEREAETHGFRSATSVLDSAFRVLAAGDQTSALRAMNEALCLPNADYYDVSRAIQLCVKVDSICLEGVVQSAAFRRLPNHQKQSLCDEMLVNREACGIAERTLRDMAEGRSLSFVERTSLTLALIAQGKFESAMSVVSRSRPEPSDLDHVEAFNYGMAQWGHTHQPPVDYYQSVLDSARGGYQPPGKNACQAFAIAAWVVGDTERALAFWRMASTLANSDAAATFSAWHYLLVSAEQFRSDLSQVRGMLEGEPILPPVLTVNWSRG